MRIASPPTQWPCFYGVDTPTRSELIAATHSLDEVNQYITSDTLAYLSLDSLTSSVIAARRTPENIASDERESTNPDSRPSRRKLPTLRPELTKKSFCHACWSGQYPIEFTPHERKAQLPLLHV